MQRYRKYQRAKKLSNVVNEYLNFGQRPGLQRGQVLSIYQSKLFELIGCALVPYDMQYHTTPFAFNVPDFSDGYCLGTAADPVPLTDQQKRRRQSLVNAIDRAWLTGQDAPPKSEAYRHPVFMIQMRPGSPWIAELHARRYQLLRAINKRLKTEFVKKVRIK